MKILLSVLISTLLAVVAAPQKCSRGDDQPLDKPPEFPGGQKAMIDYFGENLEYPEEAKNDSVQGRVMVMFVVNKDGRISHTKVVNGINPLLDSAAVRCVRNMPPWKPAKHNGEPAAVMYQVPVLFVLD